MLKQRGDEKQNELLSMVHSLLFSIHGSELQCFKRGQCSGSCIRHLLVKLLRYSGYDAAVCTSKWHGFDKIPGGTWDDSLPTYTSYWESFLYLPYKFSCGLNCLCFFQSGDHEYIDVIVHGDTTDTQRLIVDIDFRSHFEIARAVDSYGTLLNSLPVVYVGTLPCLKQYLHVMVDAAKWSLEQNSMPLPPWRSLPYLQAKWQSKYERKNLITEQGFHGTASDHTVCIGHLKRLKTSLQSELETERLLMMPMKADKKRMPKFERPWRRSLLSCWYRFLFPAYRRTPREMSSSLLLDIFVFPGKGRNEALFTSFGVYR